MTSLGKICYKLGHAIFITFLFAEIACAQMTNENESEFAIEEIVVTSRHRSESLQDVPDSITAFDTEMIVEAGIDELIDVFNLTPNILIREGSQQLLSYITIRGITTAQLGWPPIAYVVDGVQTNTLDAIAGGTLMDIERIEVLKGPQGALYGAGAIAGAVNVVTKRPNEETEVDLSVEYGKGDDKRFAGAISGKLIEEVLFGRLSLSYRDTDGLINDVDNLDLDFEEQISVRGQLLFQPTNNFTADIKTSYMDSTVGSVHQPLLSSAAEVNSFSSAQLADRTEGFTGEEDRKMYDFSLKADYEMSFATLTAIGSYLNIKQDSFGSASFRVPPNQGIFGVFLLGDTATNPGDPIDDFQDVGDDYENTNLDFRLTSSSDQRLRWIVGASYFNRDGKNTLNLGEFRLAQPDIYFLQRTDNREDKWWGIYGQMNYDVTDKLELTVAARYDDATYETTQYADRGLTVLVPALDANGNVVNSLKASATAFQPKIQMSYDFRDNLLLYGTYSEGFRPGFFSTGNLTNDEDSKNYEVGFKSELFQGTTIVNGAVFYTEYSEQQISFSTNVPPFRITQNVESSVIMGFELEARRRLNQYFTLSGGMGYIHAETDAGLKLPATPEWTINAGLSLRAPLTDKIDLVGRFDYRYQDSFRAGTVTSPFPIAINSQNLVNMRLGLGMDRWTVTAFVKNLLNERHATEVVDFGIGIARSENKPRYYGVRVNYSF